MPLLLSIESATHGCSVALHHNGVLMASKENTVPQTTATQLMPMVDAVFLEIGKSKNELSGVVISEGPGSYTGLRIGVATAKGICFALGIPLIAVNTLELLAYQFCATHQNRSNEQAILCPMLDARRLEVYCMLLDFKLNVIEPTQAKVIDEDSFSSYLHKQIFFFGDGSDKCKTIITKANAQFVPALIPMAQSLGEIGFKKWESSNFVDVMHFEPYYLKDFMIKKPNLI
jgi:tRNA threonylcarbamoyladenosine biosynthesis protein TsaB